MNSYIGTKLIKAEVMNLGDYNKYKGWQIPADEEPEKEGYLVQYSDDYCSWSPKDVFEKAYLKVDDNPVLPSGVSVGPERKTCKHIRRQDNVGKVCTCEWF